MKLISMTDFVLQFDKPVGYYEDQSDFLHCQVDYMTKVINYAKFLKQPLKLEMFVPCDENGNVLTEPKEDDLNSSSFEKQIYFNEFKKYEKAKEKVLFKGFEKRIKDIEAFKQHLIITGTVENAIEWDLTLTESAIKQFM